MNLGQIGKILSQGRAKKGWTLDQVSKKTCISRFQLEAIEKGDIKKLPARAYVRGFIQSYAKVLDLDATPLLELFGSVSIQQPFEVRKFKNIDKELIPFFSLSRISLIVATVCFAGLILWMRSILNNYEVASSGQPKDPWTLIKRLKQGHPQLPSFKEKKNPSPLALEVMDQKLKKKLPLKKKKKPAISAEKKEVPLPAAARVRKPAAKKIKAVVPSTDISEDKNQAQEEYQAQEEFLPEIQPESRLEEQEVNNNSIPEERPLPSPKPLERQYKDDIIDPFDEAQSNPYDRAFQDVGRSLKYETEGLIYKKEL